MIVIGDLNIDVSNCDKDRNTVNCLNKGHLRLSENEIELTETEMYLFRKILGTKDLQ